MRGAVAMALVCVLGSVAYATIKRSEVLRRVAQSTVTIETDKETFASGTVVAQYDQYSFVVTCNHVVEGTSGPLVVCSSLYKASCGAGVILKLDEAHDLALVLVTSPIAAVPLPIAKKDPLLFDTVYLMGNANAVANTTSEGIFSDFDSTSLGMNLWRVTGGFVFPGISGGTATNEAGELVCVPNIVAGSHVTPGMPLPQIGFCVPREHVLKLVEGYVHAPQ